MTAADSDESDDADLVPPNGIRGSQFGLRCVNLNPQHDQPIGANHR
ncbi:MAG: hypothetical protein H0V47_12880 [Chloroflexia bacterium]|jgi:hypothetical protein|nr:hypothetical protein [Chloroflexia bacterium]